MALDARQTIGTLASTHPASVRVFQRHGIDFCCGGRKTLADTCVGQSVTAAQILEEIEVEEQARIPADIDWTQAPLARLVDHVLERFHAPLRPELERLVAMARKVNTVHRAKDPERLDSLVVLVADIQADMDSHMRKEELVLFPAIVAGAGSRANGPIAVMEMEHRAAGQQLEELGKLTNDFQVPAGACATWTALWQGLEELDRDLRLHMHLENNIMFPRALAEPLSPGR